jgi:hypothetical protein
VPRLIHRFDGSHGGLPTAMSPPSPIRWYHRRQPIGAHAVGSGPERGWLRFVVCRWSMSSRVKVDSNQNINQDQPGMGLHQPIGNDPSNPTQDYFSISGRSPLHDRRLDGFAQHTGIRPDPLRPWPTRRGGLQNKLILN